jgi:hypothetical protein
MQVPHALAFRCSAFMHLCTSQWEGQGTTPCGLFVATGTWQDCILSSGSDGVVCITSMVSGRCERTLPGKTAGSSVRSFDKRASASRKKSREVIRSHQWGVTWLQGILWARSSTRPWMQGAGIYIAFARMVTPNQLPSCGIFIQVSACWTPQSSKCSRVVTTH